MNINVKVKVSKMKQLYQVILSNACERMPINETVLANSREHALNFILNKHNEHIDNFVVVMVQPIENIAPEEFDHNDNKLVFSDENVVVDHKQESKERNIISIQVGDEILHFDSGIFEIIINEAMKKELKNV